MAGGTWGPFAEGRRTRPAAREAQLASAAHQMEPRRIHSVDARARAAARLAGAPGATEWRISSMMRRTLSLLFTLLVAAPVAALAQSAYPVTTGKAYKFEMVAPGVYYATATGAMVTGSNNVAVVGDRDVLVVDTGTSPAAARAFVEDVKLVTTKPIRYVVNTHFHYDHTDGNQVYAGKAEIIAHDYVKSAMSTLDV